MVKTRLLDAIMQEAIPMPGFPQLIVSRGWLYQWLVSCGWKMSERGYGSLDYIVFSTLKVANALTNIDERDYWLSQVRGAYDRGAC